MQHDIARVNLTVCPTFTVKGTKSRGRVRQPITDPHTVFILSDPSNFDFK